MMTAKCICFAGNSVGSKIFRDKVNDADMEGNLLHQYDTIMDFFTRNLHNVQVKMNSTAWVSWKYLIPVWLSSL